MTELHVFFSPAMVADSLSFSPSAAKPLAVVDSWKRRLALKLHEPTPITPVEFSLAHDPEHVRAVLDCRSPNGFRNYSKKVADSLPWTSGAMLSAARYAIRQRTLASAPCSGFHHAGYDTVQGFCTFNGLMVTACALRKEGLASRVGILDFDMHYGNGTEEIIRRLGAEWVVHFTAGRDYHSPQQAEPFLANIPSILNTFRGCDVVLYQAGADPHIDDPLGGWLTTEQLRQRDALVFEAFAAMGMPVAWNLAGGYQTLPKLLEIHDNTAIECLRVLAGSVPDAGGKPSSRRNLSRAALSVTTR